MLLKTTIEARITIVKIEMEVNENSLQDYKKEINESHSDYMKGFYQGMVARFEAKQEAKKQHLRDLEEILQAI